MKKLVRLVAGLATATSVATTGALVSSAGPAAAIDGTVYYSASKVTYGQVLTVHGTSSATQGKAFLLAKPYHGSWSVVGTDTSPASFSFGVKPSKYTQYYVRVVDTAAGEDGSTAARAITVTRKLTRPAVHPRTKTITGTVAPAYKKRLVTIQKRSCTSCSWKKAKVVRTNKGSKWTLRIPVKRMQYRAVVSASNGLVKSSSPVTQVVVTYGRPFVG